VDSSTQSTKVLLCRAENGEVVAQGSAPHPPGTECHPREWWAALQRAGSGLLDRAAATEVAGQRHGMIVLDADDQVIRPALLWNDLRSAPQATALVAEFGGPRGWAERTGSVPGASFTVTKLRWLAEHEPTNAGRVCRVMLPHDWLMWRLGADGPVADRGDASGTGYFATRSGHWLLNLVTAALGHDAALPRVAGPAEVVGETRAGTVLAAGTGDNMAQLSASAFSPGEVAVSSAHPARCSPSVRRRAPILRRRRRVRRCNRAVPAAGLRRQRRPGARGSSDHDRHRPARAVRARTGGQPGAGGLTLLPYLDGERTPDRPTTSRE
jgi:xylulokinase